MTSSGGNLLNPLALQIPISTLSSVIWPSKPSFSVRIAVWTASSSSTLSSYLKGEKLSIKEAFVPCIIWLMGYSMLMNLIA